MLCIETDFEISFASARGQGLLGDIWEVLARRNKTNNSSFTNLLRVNIISYNRSNPAVLYSSCLLASIIEASLPI